MKSLILVLLFISLFLVQTSVSSFHSHHHHHDHQSESVKHLDLADLDHGGSFDPEPCDSQNTESTDSGDRTPGCELHTCCHLNFLPVAESFFQQIQLHQEHPQMFFVDKNDSPTLEGPFQPPKTV